jgi:hypothetical protein
LGVAVVKDRVLYWNDVTNPVGDACAVNSVEYVVGVESVESVVDDEEVKAPVSRPQGERSSPEQSVAGSRQHRQSVSLTVEGTGRCGELRAVPRGIRG